MVQNTYRVPYSGFPHEENTPLEVWFARNRRYRGFSPRAVQATGETDSLLEQWDSNRRSPLAKVRVIGEEKRPEVIAWSRKDVVFSPGGQWFESRFLQALSPLRTSFSGGKRGKFRGDDMGRSRR
jgi:hypothetical protein